LGGHGDDGNPVIADGRLPVADPAGGFQAFHLAQWHVHEQQGTETTPGALLSGHGADEYRQSLDLT